MLIRMVYGEYRFEETTSTSEQANLVQLGRVDLNERTKTERRNETRKHERTLTQTDQ
jgi:hypothetical protein